MLQCEAVLGMPIATRTAICYMYIHLLITTSQPVVITSIHHRCLCIQLQVCSTVNTAVVTALCITLVLIKLMALKFSDFEKRAFSYNLI